MVISVNECCRCVQPKLTRKNSGLIKFKSTKKPVF